MREFVLVFLLAFTWLPALAQRGEPGPPVVGLALSGGAAKGLAHIGVIQVLEEEGIPIDVVTGTSMGALIGGLYAVGYDGKALERIVTETDIRGLVFGPGVPHGLSLSDAVTPGPTLVEIPTRGLKIDLPDGMLTGQALISLFADLTWDYQGTTDFRDLPRAFACHAVELVSGNSVIIDQGYLPIAMRTCMSLPSFFRPVRQGDSIYVDGGPHHMLPVPEARHLGADVIIGVDVSGDVDPETGEVRLTPTGNEVNLLVLFESAASAPRRARAIEHREAVDILVEPDITRLSWSNLAAAAEWIQVGREAAHAVLPEIRELRKRVRPHSLPDPPAMAPVRIDEVRFSGVESGALRLAQSAGHLNLPANLSPRQVDLLVERLVATGNYDYVIPRIRPGADGEPGVLELDLTPKDPPDRLGVGLRYDDTIGGELLAELVLRHRIRYGDRSTLSVRLGNQLQAIAVYTAPIGLTSPVEIGGRISATEAPIRAQLGDDENRLSSLTQRVTEAALLAGWTPHPRLLLGLALQAGAAVNTVIDFPIDPTAVLAGPGGDPVVVDLQDVQISETFASTKAWVIGRTLDRLGVPSRGLSLHAEIEIGTGNLDASELTERLLPESGAPDTLLQDRSQAGASPFQRGLIDIQGYLPFVRRVSLIGRIAYTRGSGRGLPFNRENYIGGIQPVTVLPGTFLPLYGHPSQAATGPNAWLGVAGAQWKAGSDLFLRLFANAGRVFGDDERVVAKDGTLTGLGLDIVYRLPVGPLTFSLGTRRIDRWPDFGLRLGYVF
ncbi:MAG TPA: patatin-like phospholipase family protein [Rhodothermales bacterium]|nr:patatin-like phospholipase family protein [Rhodothermales bacterium]